MHTILLLLTVTSTLVLRSGDRIAVEGPVRQENGVVQFRSAGVLYSLPADEVVRVETPEPVIEAKAEAKPGKEFPKRLGVSEEQKKKKLAELQKNHGGTPAKKQAILDSPPPPPTPAEVDAQKREEWSWRLQARGYEEAIRRAQEEVQLLESRIEDLKQRIHGFVAQGFAPRQFTYESTQLAYAEERLPYARLEVERAQRAYDQFREDARRQGILPGWLR
ncbi:MAG TPA: hypothetical protein VJZ00_01440 [Thermoanaerobaculia bacterium]|nr:hypothetical protein [Thermoanaerobaculia bacterium]